MDHLLPLGSADYVHKPTHKYRELDTRATKFRYPKHCIGNVIYEEHPNGSIMKLDSPNVVFLKNEFPSATEIKNDLELYELQQDVQLSLSEAEDLVTHCVSEHSTHNLPEIDNGKGLIVLDGGNLSIKEN